MEPQRVLSTNTKTHCCEMYRRALLSAALLCLCAHAHGASMQQQLVKELLPGVGNYYFYRSPMNWTDAANYCREHNLGNLAYPRTLDEAEFMNKMMETNNVILIHAGFHDLFKEGEYYTVTGDRLTESCFNTLYNQPASPNRNCGALRSSPMLEDIHCKGELTFFCVNYNFYKEDFDLVPGHGYYKMHSAERTWVDAEQTCEMEGTKLLVLNSDAELAALAKTYGAFTTWVGVHHLYKNWQFISITDEELASTGYDRWASGQPSGTNDQKPYLIVSSAPGSGLALRSATERFNFICEEP